MRLEWEEEIRMERWLNRKIRMEEEVRMLKWDYNGKMTLEWGEDIRLERGD